MIDFFFLFFVKYVSLSLGVATGGQQKQTGGQWEKNLGKIPEIHHH